MKHSEFTTKEGHVFRQIGDHLHSQDDTPAVVYADGAQALAPEFARFRTAGQAAGTYQPVITINFNGAPQ